MLRALRPLAAAVAVMLLPGCVTGERPTLAESPTTTGDPAVDELIARLDAAGQATFTGTYDVLTRFGNLQSAATVAQSGPARRSVTIGEVRFLTDLGTTATCELDAGACVDRIDAALVSDTQLSPDFYASSAAARLRRDAGGRVGPIAASTERISGQDVSCVAIPVTGSTATYCVLESGPVARIDAADVVVELTSFSTSVDEAQFQRPGG